jgi:cytosine/adenosine deaminase-related metal-dependent hydrolase
LTVAHVEVLTAFSLARALRAGVTTVFEHLHAPNVVAAALQAQARTARRLGARLVTSHASSSQTPRVPGPAQVEANAEFVTGTRRDELVRGLIGVCDSSNADDDLLRAAGRAKEELGVGAHFRLASSDSDLAKTWAKYNARIVNRFETFGLLGGSSIGAHARAIDRAEAAKLAKTRTLIALSPRTAQTLEGGSAFGMEAVLLNHNLVGLGTGGASSMWDKLSASFANVMALTRAGRMIDPDDVMSSFLIRGPAELCTMIFGVPSGAIDEGALADLVVYDTLPPRESQHGAQNVLMQLSQERVAWSIVNGRVVVREGQLVGADFLSLAAEARAVLESLWQ